MELVVEHITQAAPTLCAGQRVLLTGSVYTARDAAHKKIAALVRGGEELPFSLRGAVIYYAGPTQTPPHLPIGSCGPTTSGRMDPYSELMLQQGVAAMIGKGERDDKTIRLLSEFGGVYFAALGGAGALAAQHIKSCEVIAFEELGCESVKRLWLEKFPAFVAVDCHGGNIYDRATAAR